MSRKNGVRPDYDLFSEIEIDIDEAPRAKSWIELASNISATKLSIFALLFLITTVELQGVTEMLAVFGIIGLGVLETLLRCTKDAKGKEAGFSKNESSNVSKRKGYP